MNDKVDTTAANVPAPGTPSGADVLAQLSRILGSPGFTANANRNALLRYLVEETLAGREQMLKGFNIGSAVFGRKHDFNQQTDPIVRIEARRLRSDLDRYYAGVGRNDSLRISIPKGIYVPHFDWQVGTTVRDVAAAAPEAGAGTEAAVPPLSPEKPATKRRMSVAVALTLVAGLALVVAAAGVWSRYQPQPDPANVQSTAQSVPLIVLPFATMSASADSALIAEGLTQQLIADLMRFSGLRLFTANASFRQSPDADPVQMAADLGVSYVVRGGVATEEGNLRVVASLVEAKTGRVVWSETYDRALTPGAFLGVEGAVAGEIATALGQSYGPLKSDLLERARQLAEPGMDNFLCVLKARSYRRTFDETMLGPVQSCLQDAVRQDPSYAEVWAMLGWLKLDQVRYNLVPASAAAQTMDAAMKAAAHAVELEPDNVTALQALAAISYYSGKIDESERLMHVALALNPNDPETLVQYGWRLAARGKWDEGIPLVEKAIARTLNPPGWYYHSIAVHQYLQGDYSGAIASAERSALNGSAVGWSVVAAAQAALGNDAEAQKAVVAMGEADPDMKADPAAVLRTHQIVEPTVEALVSGLKKAGWSPPP